MNDNRPAIGSSLLVMVLTNLSIVSELISGGSSAYTFERKTKGEVSSRIALFKFFDIS